MPDDPNLRAVIRIKTMADKAAGVEVTSPEIGSELVAAYERLRNDAAGLATRAGWNENDEFELEIPRLQPQQVRATHQTMAPFGGPEPYQDVVAGRQAKVLLGQLSAWAEGHQQTFELETQLKANAKLKRDADAAQAKAERRTGFGAPEGNIEPE